MQKPTQPQAIIFDLYGVLAFNGWKEFKAKHFEHYPEEWRPLAALATKVDAGTAEYQDLLKAIATATHESVATVRGKLEQTTPNPELLQFIATELASYKLAIVSNASHDVTGSIFTPAQLQLFTAVVTSFHVGLTKPDPAIFALAAERLQVPPEYCVVVDDQQRHLDAAASLGMQTILYTDVAHTREALRQRGIA